MMGRLCRAGLALSALAVVPGCELLGIGDTERLGVLYHGPDSTVVFLPASAAVDSTFHVRFHTFGGGCVSADRTDVALGAETATVTPIDRDSGAQSCTDVLKFLQHEAEVYFATPGTRDIVIRGRQEPGGGAVEIRRSVVIRPH